MAFHDGNKFVLLRPNIKGEAGSYLLALWEKNGFIYAVRAGEKPMTKEKILEIAFSVD